MSTTAENIDRMVGILKDKTLLITGGTGFVGKVFIDKVLRVTDIEKIFMIVRIKKGKSPKERLIDIFNNPLFDSLKKLKGESILKKIHLIPGDLSQLELGISKEDRNSIVEQVHFIFHCAATIRFDENIKPAVLLNVRGTKFMLELAKQCKKLMVFCHLSTSYCHLNERILYEKMYPPATDPDAIIKICELLSDDVINSISDKILQDMPNSYAFTKGLAEGLINEQMDKLPILPIVLLRPSIIVPVWKEPIPGWTDNINGPIGLLIGAGKGVIRTMYGDRDAYGDYVPVDVVANCMLCSVCDYLLYKERRIYNVTSSAEYKLTFEEMIEIGRNIIETRIPLNGVFWYPGGSMTKSRLQHNINFFCFQWVPAVIVDILLIILGYKPVLKRVQRRVWNGYKVFEYYANKQWDFNNDGSMEARKFLTPLERERYKVDGEGINYEEYFTDCIYAARRYILHETDDTIPAAKRHMRVMWWADTICKTVIIIGFFYLLWRYIALPLIGSF